MLTAPLAVLLTAAISCSNFFSNVSTRVLSSDLMASSGEEFTTLQTIALSFNLNGVGFDMVEALSPRTVMVKIERKREGRNKQQGRAFSLRLPFAILRVSFAKRSGD